MTGRKAIAMKFVAVERNTNPKSENYGTWYVIMFEDYNKPMETVFRDKSKKACVEYAKTLTEKPYVSNGVEYGARF